MTEHRLLSLDFETYYDKEYSLRRMSIPEYILDRRFEVILCSVQVEDEKPFTVEAADIPALLREHPPEFTATVIFNALFDNAILAWRYGYVPAQMFDTMGMARAVIGHKLEKGASLKAVAAALNMPAKGDTVHQVVGMRAAAIKALGMWPAYCAYCNLDNQLNKGIFNRLIHDLPRSERRIMDMVLRCAIQPRFKLDIPLLEQHLVDVRAEKAALLQRAGVGKSDLMSNVKFQRMLEDLGVEVQMKTSGITGKLAPALAKTDRFMAELKEHPDLRVQTLVAARLGHKSTQEETRAESLLAIARLPWPKPASMPIPLRYAGAHTHRLSGEWGINMQNLPSSRSGKSKLRRSLLAPDGHKVITCDLGQIEARLNAWFCGAHNLLGQFALGQDPYKVMASKIFNKHGLLETVTPLERFIGKTAILGLGYGCGAPRFYNMVETQSRQFNIDLQGIWSKDLAVNAVATYRSAYSSIPDMWGRLQIAIHDHWLGNHGVVGLGPKDVIKIDHGYIEGPNGLCLRYSEPKLEHSATENGLSKLEYTYKYGRFSHRIYGAKLLENIIQFLARVVVMNAALRIAGHAPFEEWSRFVLQAHDELVYIVPDAMVDEWKKVVHLEMTRRPTWAKDIPLKADIGVGQSYGEAK